jgi:dTDP-3-amino-3,4,6-trideoxy-alpha-D-glucose transaminase
VIRFRELGREVEELRAELDGAVAGVLDDARFVLGPFVEEFERAFAAFCGARHGVGVASGTDAIAIALRATGVRPGDEVVTQANTCVPTVAGIERAGARPVLADVDPETASLDPARLAELVTPSTRAVVPVHLYGQCADMGAISEVARAHGLTVVEDAAQAHGASYGGRRAGTLGAAAAFSFYPTKNLGALGDAGMVVTDDDAVAERARLLRSYGERRRYESELDGWNSRLDALQAAVLSVKLPRLERWNERRRALASRYDDALARSPLVRLGEARGRRHVYHLYVVRGERRDELRRQLAERGVETLVHYPRAVHQHPAYAHLAGRRGSLATSERLASEALSLPLYPQLTDGEVDAVVGALAA